MMMRRALEMAAAVTRPTRGMACIVEVDEDGHVQLQHIAKAARWCDNVSRCAELTCTCLISRCRRMAAQLAANDAESSNAGRYRMQTESRAAMQAGWLA